MFGPPPLLEPARVFRLLIQRPRPWWPVVARLAGDDRPLRVRGLTGVEVESMIDALPKSPDMRGREGNAALIAMALTDARGRLVFETAEDVGDVEEDEFADLAQVVREGLRAVSPVMHRCAHYEKWETVLDAGALDPSNYSTAFRIGTCIDESGERPDRYFGVAIGDLTDGQIMAYRAATRLVERSRKKDIF